MLTAALFSILAAGCAKDFETVKIHFADESDNAVETRLQQFFAERVTIDSDGPDRILADGFANFRNKLYGSSRVLVEGHLLDEPSDWRGHYVLALLDIAEEDYEGGERCLQAALRFAPQDTQLRGVIYLALGHALERKGQPALSEQHYLTALNLDSTLSPAQDGIQRLRALSSVEPR